MEGRFVLTDYVDQALSLAVYDKLVLFQFNSIG